jgi:hypothetical protein
MIIFAQKLVIHMIPMRYMHATVRVQHLSLWVRHSVSLSVPSKTTIPGNLFLAIPHPR